MELASLIISIVAIFLSLLVTIWQNKCSKAINDINLEADLLKELITKPLTEEIPNAYKDLCFPNGVLSETEPLQTAITNLLEKLRFFKYYDAHFYSEIKKKGQALEDYIVSNDGKHFDNDDMSKTLDEISQMISEVYFLLKSKYHGKKY